MEENILQDKTTAKLQFICQRFRIPGDVVEWRRITSGHINEAYCVRMRDGLEEKMYLVQRVNTYVFHDPAGMMRNVDLITKHIMEKEPTVERRRRLHYHHTADGKNYLILKNGTEDG